ncbi:MAG: class D sortase [Terracidiphilus sp.]
MFKTKQSDSNKAGGRRWGVFSNPRPLWRRLEWALLFAGIALVVGVGAAHIDGYLSSRAALKAFTHLDGPPGPIESEQTATDTEGAHEPVFEEPDFSNWSEGRVRAYRSATAKQAGAPLGVLEIPALSVVVPLLEGADALTLNRGVGRIQWTARPGEDGNIGVAGHRDSFFRRLKDIKTGDVIQLRRRDGLDSYAVERIEIVSPRDVGVLSGQGAPAMTLVTCYPFYFIGSAPQRFVVTAFLTQHTPAGSVASTTR